MITKIKERKPLPKCIDCGNNLGNYNKGRKRCRPCYFKYFRKVISQSKSFKNKIKKFMIGRYIGNKHPRWVGGIERFKCIKCKKQITFGRTHCKSCATQGKLNPNYIHGKANEPYSKEFNSTLKRIINIFYNYTCQKCFNKGNTIHHIDYNKQNCKKDNLITLCKKCNPKVNANRDYWFAYFTYLKNL